MSYLYICNTFSDYISKVNLAVFKEEAKIHLKLHKVDKVGPHHLCIYKDTLLTANSYSNSLSIIDLKENKEVENYFIGMHCNGVEVCDDNAYVICGESNNIIVFNLNKKKIIEEIPCGSFPHSIAVEKHKRIIAVANMQNDSVTLLDCSDKEKVLNIKVSSYPTKVVFTPDGENILVCESNIGADNCGTLSFINIKSLNVLWRISTGNSPVDIYCDENYCYVSNFGDGTVSIVDINKAKEVKRLKVGGMPRGIVKEKEFLYIGDNYNNLLIQLNIAGETKRVIPIGGEPTGMALI